MKMQIFDSADSLAQSAATLIAAEARNAVRAYGRFVWAVSGGHTPWRMLRILAAQDVPWNCMQIVQVDERIAPFGHQDRNLTHLTKSLLEQSPLRVEQIHAMPVESPELEAAAEGFARRLSKIAGSPSIFDLVHLGLGADGHTASLVPGDPVLDVTDSVVAVTGVYQGRRRMTLTYPILNRSRRILWIVSGGAKAAMLARLRAGDKSIPAGRVNQENALVLADREAAGKSEPVEFTEE
ncbi:MAG: 6-phosphogluconolactonase [Bacteroidota bacterium]